MPTYEYACLSCGHNLEAFQRMSDEPLSVCPECTAPTLKRKIGLGAGIIFKGGGFYETDFKDRKGHSGESGEKTEASKGKEGGTDSGPATTETPAKKDVSAKESQAPAGT
ncbi:MAG: zinc ribbon domain-containing protein [Oceanipulchritudo sp.]